MDLGLWTSTSNRTWRTVNGGWMVEAAGDGGMVE